MTNLSWDKLGDNKIRVLEYRLNEHRGEWGLPKRRINSNANSGNNNANSGNNNANAGSNKANPGSSKANPGNNKGNPGNNNANPGNNNANSGPSMPGMMTM